MLQKLIAMLTGKMAGGQLGSLLGPLSSMLGGGGGGGGGIGDILSKFTKAGLGGKADSWVGGGANQALSAKEVRRALGDDEVARIAKEAGVSKRQAAGGLASLLPKLVDKATPDGKVAEGGSFDVGSLTKMLGL